jgi:hypothetical protein
MLPETTYAASGFLKHASVLNQCNKLCKKRVPTAGAADASNFDNFESIPSSYPLLCALRLRFFLYTG